MSREMRSPGSGTTRGFAGMDQEKQREIARKGGANVPHEKRSFAQNRALAAEAGRKGGRSVAPQDRSFAQNRELAAAAGRKGGRASQSRRISGQAETPEGSPNGPAGNGQNGNGQNGNGQHE